MNYSRCIALLLAALTLSTPLVRAAAPAESAADRDERMEWFREARFGMFIHWGLYSVLAGEWNGKPVNGAGEWIMETGRIPVSEYEKLAPQFNPTNYNARQWVRLAKNAGMKYIVITSKHHDGFGLWRSGTTDWCMNSTPSQRDLLKELADACRKEGVRLCFYHSIMDWHHPDWGTRRAWHDKATGEPDMARYLPYLKAQLKELLTNYGPIGILWFDGEWEKAWTYEQGVDLYHYVRKLQPDIIINNRVGKGRAGMSGMDKGSQGTGDYGTPEQEVPARGFGPGVDWESCMTMNDTWGFKKSDHNWKSTQTLVRNLVDCASKGGNYLLNVGPTADGLIPEASVERLEGMGRWMKVNHEAIYETTASPFKQLSWGRCTQKATRGGTLLYLHVFEWPKDGKLLVPGLKTSVSKAWLLADRRGKALTTTAVNEGLQIALPTSAPDPISSTVVLRLKGKPELEEQRLTQAPDGRLSLPATAAKLHGSELAYEPGSQRDSLGFWTNPEDWAEWEFVVTKPGRYTATATVAGLGASKLEVSVADKTLIAETPNTGNYGAFERIKVGTFVFPATGKLTLRVEPVKAGWQPVNLRTIEMAPE